jgi:hypothetical protein
MLLRREDAHPSRRFSILVYAIPGKTASRFAWENRFTLFLELL